VSGPRVHRCVARLATARSQTRPAGPPHALRLRPPFCLRPTLLTPALNRRFIPLGGLPNRPLQASATSLHQTPDVHWRAHYPNSRRNTYATCFRVQVSPRSPYVSAPCPNNSGSRPRCSAINRRFGPGVLHSYSPATPSRLARLSHWLTAPGIIPKALAVATCLQPASSTPRRATVGLLSSPWQRAIVSPPYT